MQELQLTGLQKRATKYLNKTISYKLRPEEVIEGYFAGFDEKNNDRAIIQVSNAADVTSLPLQTVVNFFEGVDQDDDDEESVSI